MEIAYRPAPSRAGSAIPSGRRCLLFILAALGAISPAGAVTVQGRVAYEKVPVSVKGLDVEHPVATPSGAILVEARNAEDPNKLLASASADDGGNYRLDIPDGSDSIRLFFWARMGNVSVVDPDTSQVYYVYTEPFDAKAPPSRVLIPDRGRLSGPFNILAAIRRANRFLEQFDPNLRLNETYLTIYWSPTALDIPVTHFQLSRSIAWVLGQRDEDSDEFDDHVLIHEYAHYLAARYSRDDSPGGLHWLGQREDPRLAWSEGWAHFFATAVLGSPVFIDTKGPGGEDVLAFDVDEDVHDGDSPGYWSELSVASILWDLFADAGIGSGHLGLGFQPIWHVLREHFPKQVWVTVLTLADGLIQRDTGRQAEITGLLARRSIEYRFGVVPSVPNPFPRLITPGTLVTGTVDSYTTGRTNLLGSADYFVFKKETEGPVDIRLKVVSSRFARAGDLVLVIYNSRRFMMAIEDKQHTIGTTEQFLRSLPPDTYIIGVESYLQTSQGFRTGAASYQLTAEY